MKKFWKNWAATSASIAALSVGLVATATPVLAQTSFGKMRDATGKTEKPDVPAVDDATNGKKDDAAPSTPSTGRTTLKRRSNAPGGNSPSVPRTSASSATSRTSASSATSRTSASSASSASETNGIAAAASAPLVESEETPTSPTALNGANAVANPPLGSEPPRREDPPKPALESESSNAAANGKRGPVFGLAKSTKYRAGMIFEARPNGTCSDLLGTAPVPMEFPEQKVRTLDENFPTVARVDYRDLKEGGARQMVFKMRQLKPGQRVEATVLFEVTRYPLLPPTNPELYSIPKTPPRDYRLYLKEGPYIESDSKTVRALGKEITKGIDGDWEKVAAILKYVRDNITYKEAQIEKPMRGALAALRTRDGDCEDMSALFIALCRSLDVPARLVRVPGHCWAEFYLVDDEKNGYWFPAQVAGTEELGSLQDVRVILQKGDNFRLPETPKEESLYVKELFTGNVKENSPDPVYQFIQEPDAK